MRGQHFADFVNRFCERVTEFFILKMEAHPVDNMLPELFAAFFVNRFVANNSEFVGSRRYENQHRIALAGLMHSKAVKLLLCNDQRIGVDFAALDIDANFAGRF
jgi:hypothetical protein